MVNVCQVNAYCVLGIVLTQFIHVISFHTPNDSLR